MDPLPACPEQRLGQKAKGSLDQRVRGIAEF